MTHPVSCNFSVLKASEVQFYSSHVAQYFAGGKIEKNEMGGTCGAYGGGERCAQGSSGET